MTVGVRVAGIVPASFPDACAFAESAVLSTGRGVGSRADVAGTPDVAGESAAAGACAVSALVSAPRPWHAVITKLSVMSERSCCRMIPPCSVNGDGLFMQEIPAQPVSFGLRDKLDN